MDGFYWNVDGEQVKIIFSMIRNAEWIGDGNDTMMFDFLDYYTSVSRLDMEDVDGNMDEYYSEVWSMLLQASGLDASLSRSLSASAPMRSIRFAL